MTTAFGAVRVPLGAPAELARLTFDNGAEQVTITADATLDALLEAQFGNPQPELWHDDHNVHVDYPLGSRLLRRMRPSTIRLNPTTAWSVEIHGGAAYVDLDLTGIALHSLSFHASAAHCRIAIGRPTGERYVRLRSIKQVSVQRPADTPVRLEIPGAAVGVAIDDVRYGAIAGLTERTPKFSTTRDRYVVYVSGGADKITIGTAPDGQSGPKSGRNRK